MEVPNQTQQMFKQQIPLLEGNPHQAQGGLNSMPYSLQQVVNPINYRELEDKKKEFEKGVYVSGFEKTLTVAMLREEFAKVKPVHGIKLPITKFN